MFDFPNSPTAGQIITSSNGASYQWDGTKWSARSGSTPVISDTPPSNPAAGTLWWDSAGGQLYVWFVDADSAQWVVANNAGTDPTVGASLNNSGRNLIINGQFNVWQRGNGPFTTNVGYTADRWQLYFTGDTTSVTAYSMTDAIRSAIGDESARTALLNTFTGTSAAGNFNEIVHKVENVTRLAGKTVTLSFWAWCASGALKLGVGCYQYFGSGGSPSAPASMPRTPVQLSTAVTRYTLTFRLPSIAGTTLGTNNDDCTVLQFFYSSGTTNFPEIGVQSGQIGLWGVQLEVGSIATPLARRDPADELSLCQRFYQIGNLQGAFYNTAGGAVQISSMLPVTMRSASPTPATTGNANGNITGGSIASNGGSVWTSGATATATGSVIFALSYSLSADL